MKLQTLSKDAYHLYFPKILHVFRLTRPYTHLYLAHKRKLLVCYLDNYQGKKVPMACMGVPERLKGFATI